MENFLRQLFDWSEVWALFIPLSVLCYNKKQPVYLNPVIYYLFAALLLNICSDVIWKLQGKLHLPSWLHSNNFLYNIHSITRMLLFSWFFIALKQQFLPIAKKVIPFLFIIFAILNFIVFENFFFPETFSGRLFSVEATILLFYCLLYYMYMLKDDESSFRKSPSFWVVTGLSIYVVVNIPIFLFYTALLKQFRDFTMGIWDVHNISYIIFCIFIAKAFYESKR